jgi:hypothetical protein
MTGLACKELCEKLGVDRHVLEAQIGVFLVVSGAPTQSDNVLRLCSELFRFTADAAGFV